MFPKISAAGFLLIAREPLPTFLLMRHRDRWDLPKGHAEGSESLIETALRETQEETGIDLAELVRDPDFRYEIEYRVRNAKRGTYDKQVTYFLGYLKSEMPVTLTEHTGFRWWSWPPQRPIQAKTIDPLLTAVREHFGKYPERLQLG